MTPNEEGDTRYEANTGLRLRDRYCGLERLLRLDPGLGKDVDQAVGDDPSETAHGHAEGPESGNGGGEVVLDENDQPIEAGQPVDHDDQAEGDHERRDIGHGRVRRQSPDPSDVVGRSCAVDEHPAGSTRKITRATTGPTTSAQASNLLTEPAFIVHLVFRYNPSGVGVLSSGATALTRVEAVDSCRSDERLVLERARIARSGRPHG